MEKSSSEIANGLSKIGEKAFDFIEKIIANPIMEVTGVLTDKVKYWRFKNQVDTIIKAKEFLEKKGITIPHKIPIKDLTTLLEYSSLEDEPVMQDKWAKLLSNALDPNNAFEATTVFSHILNQMSIEEIKILEYMFYNSFISSDTDRPYFEKRSIRNMLEIKYEIYDLLIDNLTRLRLVEDKMPELKNASKQVYLYTDNETPDDIELVASSKIRISKFGTELMRKIL
jgi:hypothetical protein